MDQMADTAAREPRPSARWRRRAWRLVVALALLVGVCLALIHAPPVQQRLFRLGLDRAAAAIDGTIDFESARLNLFTRNLHLSGLRVQSREGPPFLEADAARVSFGWSVLRGDLSTLDLTLDRPRVFLRLAGGEIVNLPAASDDEAPGAGPAAITPAAVAVNGLQFTYDDVDAGVRVELRDLTLALRPAAAAPAARELSGALAGPAPLAITVGDVVTRGAIERARISMSDERIAWSDVGVALTEGAFESDGRFVLAGDDGLVARVRGDADAATLSRWAPALEGLDGRLRLTLDLPAPGAADAFAAFAVSSDDLGLNGLSNARLDVAGTIGDAIDLSRLALDVAGGRLAGTARIGLAEGEASRANVEWARLPVTALASAAGVEIGPSIPRSLVSGRVDARWRGADVTAADAAIETRWRRAPDARAGRDLWLAGDARLRLADGRWTLALDQAVSDVMTLAGTARGELNAAEPASGSLAGDLRLSADTVGAIRTLGPVLDLPDLPGLEGASGATVANVRLAGTLDRPRADVDLTAGLDRPDHAPAELRIDASADARRVTLRRLEAGSADSRLDASATVDLEGGRIDARFDAERVPVSSWLSLLGMSAPVQARLDLSGTAVGPLSRPRADLRLSGSDLDLAGQHFAALGGAIAWDGRELRAEELTLTQLGGGSVRVTATLRPETGALEARATGENVGLEFMAGTIDAADGPRPLAFCGRLGFDLAAGGTLARPEVNGRVAADGLSIGGEQLGVLTAALATADGRLRVEGEAPTLATEFAADLGLAPPYAFEATARLDADRPLPLTLPLGPFVGFVWGAQASLRASGALEGEQVVAEATGEIASLDATVEGMTIVVREPARVTWLPDRLAVEGLRLEAGDGTRLAIDGALAEGESLAVRLNGRLEDFSPSVAALVLGAGGSADALQITGALEADLRVAGPLASPALAGGISLSDGTLGWQQLPPVQGVTVRARIADGVLDVPTIGASWSGARLEAAASAPMAFLGAGEAGEAGAARLSGRLDGVTAAVLAPWLSRDTRRRLDLDGAAAFTFEATAPAADAVAGSLEIERLSVRAGDVAFAQQAPARIAITAGGVELEPWTIATPGAERNRLTLQGRLGLGETPSIDAAARGLIDLRLAGLAAGDLRSGGTATVDVTAAGDAASPDLSGILTIRNAELTMPEAGLVMFGLNGAVLLRNERVTVQGMRGTLNGGPLTVAGSMALPGGEPDGSLTISARNVLTDIPKGLKTVANVDLRISEQDDGKLLVAGTVTAVQGTYRQPLLFTGGLLSLLQADEGGLPLEPSDGDESPIVLDVRVVSANSLLIDNDYGLLTLGGSLRVVGSPDEPGVLGQLTIQPGGILYLAGVRYTIEAGSVNFTDPTGLEPELRLTARTSLSGYDVTVRIDGSPGDLDTSFTSEPYLAEAELLQMLLGVNTGDVTGAATEQVAAALSGELVGAVGRAIGFDSVRLERINPGDVTFDPTLVSSESDPASRLTFSKRILSNLELIGSQSLKRSGDITWIVSWEPVPRIEVRFVQLDDRDRSIEFRHDVTFGGGVVATTRRPGAGFLERLFGRPADERVQTVTVQADGALDPAALQGELKLDEGDPFDFFRWQADRERLVRAAVAQGYFEARVAAERTPETPESPGERLNRPVDLLYDVDAGPRTELNITGMTVPDDLREELVRAWTQAPVDTLLADQLRVRLRRYLAERGFVRASVDVRIARADGVKHAAVTVDPGPQSRATEVVFEGNDAISDDDLRGLIEQAGLLAAVWVQPEPVEELVRTAYQRIGLFRTEVEVRSPQFEGDVARVPISIVEGTAYTIGTIAIRDAAGTPPPVASAVPVAAGERIVPGTAARLEREVRRAYRRLGYRSARVDAAPQVRPESAVVDLTVEVERGPRQVLARVDVEGQSHTSPGLISRALDVEPGAAISPDDLKDARGVLYDTALYRSVDIQVEPADGAAPATAETEPVVARVTLEELPRWRLRYGLQLFDPVAPVDPPKWGQVDPGLVADLTRRALFGRDITAGISTRWNPSQQAVRGYASSRTWFGRPLQTNLFGGYRREEFGSRDLAFIETHIREVTLEQRTGQKGRLQFNYGYNAQFLRLDLALALPPPFGFIESSETARIGRILGGLLYDSRDDLLDATRGLFHSSNLELGPRAFGSSEGLWRYLGQQFVYRELGRGVVVASAARFEAAGGPGKRFLLSERLEAGGANTIRGYAENEAFSSLLESQVADPDEQPSREAMIILNQELRFPIFGPLHGVTFWDHGTFFQTFDDMTGRESRNGVGLGLRYNLGFLLLRADYGYPLGDDREGRDTGRFYFSIGQVF